MTNINRILLLQIILNKIYNSKKFILESSHVRLYLQRSD